MKGGRKEGGRGEGEGRRGGRHRSGGEGGREEWGGKEGREEGGIIEAGLELYNICESGSQKNTINKTAEAHLF